MTRCCARRPEDGMPDRENINRAVQGQPATLSPTEMQMAVFKLMKSGKGLNEISRHLSYSRSQVAALQQTIRNRAGGQ